MSVLHRNRNVPTEPAPAVPASESESPSTPAPASVPSRPAARTRASAAWLGACLAAALLVVLIVFMLQNTRSVEISFLWLHGSVPLAIALLIAGVGASLVTMTVAVVRITQLRRRIRQRH